MGTERVRWTRRRRSPANSPKRRPVPSRVVTWSHQNRGKQASSRPASSGVSARRFTSAKTISGSARRLGGGTLRTGLASIAPSSVAYAKLRLPATHVGRLDSLNGPVTEERAYVIAESAFCHDERIRAAVGVSRPVGPPLVSPVVERQPTSPAPPPGSAAHLQPLLVKQLAGLISAGDGPGTLAAVLHPPPDLIAHPTSAPANALADARCRHGVLLRPSVVRRVVGVVGQLGASAGEVEGAAGGGAVGG